MYKFKETYKLSDSFPPVQKSAKPSKCTVIYLQFESLRWQLFLHYSNQIGLTKVILPNIQAESPGPCSSLIFKCDQPSLTSDIF